MDERDAIFRGRLIAVMTALNGGEARDAALRRLVGGYTHRITRELGVRSWAELKRRADPATYDSLLALFERESARMHAEGDAKGVRALEALALSLIARHQKQADLVPGVSFLDSFIDTCAGAVRPVARAAPTRHPAREPLRRR